MDAEEEVQRRPTNAFEYLLSEREKDLMDLVMHTVHTALGDIVQDAMKSALNNTQESIERSGGERSASLPRAQ